ncbi:hypothetical protein AQI95_19930 [Streptomyces yokosukanensis]|uniref:Amidase domain-containing protein n=1 Tax=Streptomyces yokosukanensis TaxID=67386 RepID=A0A101P3X8_9ACTN|nr:amidase [Streptomyces yokosukanensis]KUN04472.1 hypothetical protein AQI95_19930 [Streptomyces yokosukanensis]
MASPHELTVSGLHRLYQNGEVTVSEIVADHLDRIRAVDSSLNAVVTLNPAAMEDAARLDTALMTRGPLHGVPILVKDNIETAGIATAFGSAALSDHVPATDAHLVTRLRKAGAVILGKTTLPDFAMSWHGHSSRSGITRNPYDLSRDPGGSSSGTAAAVGAGLAVAGVGTDTGGSIRIPASFCGLVGIRPTVGLVSRHGIAALVREQDSPGPLARSVTDAAALLDAMAGWDRRDPFTSLPAMTRRKGTFSDRLVPGALNGARIGVPRELCETGSGDDPDVEHAVEESLAAMRAAGAILIEVRLPGLGTLLRATFMYLRQSRRDLNHSLAAMGAPSTDVADIVASGRYCSRIALLRAMSTATADPADDATYGRALELRTQLRHLIAAPFAEHGLDALAYPSARITAPSRADIDGGAFEDRVPGVHNPASRAFPANTHMAAQALFPAISTPAGTTSSGLPVGLEFLGLPHRDADLVALAFDLERIRPPRAVPTMATAPIGGTV